MTDRDDDDEETREVVDVIDEIREEQRQRERRPESAQEEEPPVDTKVRLHFSFGYTRRERDAQVVGEGGNFIRARRVSYSHLRSPRNSGLSQKKKFVCLYVRFNLVLDWMT